MTRDTSGPAGASAGGVGWAPAWQLTLALAGLCAAALPASSRAVGEREAAVFLAVNGLPDPLMPAVWPVMQTGALGAVPVAAVVALAAGRRRTAIRLLVSGTAAWAAAKAVKRVIRRGRPVDLVPDTVIRGQADSGLGFVSGHAAVSAALALAAAAPIGATGPAPARAVVLVVPLVVGGARMYVGAHLPLDVAGGLALGAAIEALVAMAPAFAAG